MADLYAFELAKDHQRKAKPDGKPHGSASVLSIKIQDCRRPRARKHIQHCIAATRLTTDFSIDESPQPWVRSYTHTDTPWQRDILERSEKAARHIHTATDAPGVCTAGKRTERRPPADADHALPAEQVWLCLVSAAQGSRVSCGFPRQNEGRAP